MSLDSENRSLWFLNLMIFIFMILILNQMATQYIAKAFYYHKALGEPILTIGISHLVGLFGVKSLL